MTGAPASDVQDTRKPRQTVLDLPHRASSSRDDYMPGDCNAAAIALIDKWPEWPSAVAIVYGDAGCGKTHLLHIWAKRAKAVLVGKDTVLAEGFDPTVYAGQAVALEDLETFVGDMDAERALFHLYNAVINGGGHMLCASRTPPARLSFLVPDLASRLSSALAVRIEAPDETVLASLLIKLFTDRQLIVPDDVVAYILPRMHRRYADALRIADAIDKLALEKAKPITTRLARDACGF